MAEMSVCFDFFPCILYSLHHWILDIQSTKALNRRESDFVGAVSLLFRSIYLIFILTGYSLYVKFLFCFLLSLGEKLKWICFL